jgi:hypothetical protein
MNAERQVAATRWRSLSPKASDGDGCMTKSDSNGKRKGRLPKSLSSVPQETDGGKCGERLDNMLERVEQIMNQRLIGGSIISTRPVQPTGVMA